MTDSNGNGSDSAGFDTATCDGPGCGRILAPSRPGGRPRRWCSDACRMRATRSANVQAALETQSGDVTSAVVALTSALDAPAGSLAHTLGALAVVQAQQADAGQPAATTALRLTLQAIDEAAGLTARDDADWFDVFELVFSIKREGIDPQSRLAERLREWIGDRRGETLLSFYPPTWPPGWRGTALDGQPEEFCEQHPGLEWPEAEPFRFWPPAPCVRCGHIEGTDG
jgi:hypothetical protein